MLLSIMCTSVLINALEMLKFGYNQKNQNLHLKLEHVLTRIRT